jgi:pimeloyl-ACP methyl ester carboxylesterase
MHAAALPADEIPLPTLEKPAGYRLILWPAGPRGRLPCWLAVPERPDADAPPLVAVHGVRRDARGQATGFAPAAATAGRLVIAPCFAEHLYPGYQRVVTGRRADLALLELLERVGQAGLADTRHVELFGYSGGAQFAHRFAMLYPHRIRRLTLAAAGWYTFPDDAPYPYGLAPARGTTLAWGPHMRVGLSRFLAIPIRVCVGEYDNHADALTRRGHGIDRRQGTNRLERARRWVAALHHAGSALGRSPDIAFHPLPGCGHDFRSCLRLGGLAEITLAG